MTRALSTDPACTNTALTRITGEAIEALALSTFRDAQPGPEQACVEIKILRC